MSKLPRLKQIPGMVLRFVPLLVLLVAAVLADFGPAPSGVALLSRLVIFVFAGYASGEVIRRASHL